MTDLPEISRALPGYQLRRQPLDLGRGSRLSRQCRTGSRRHVCLERQPRNRFGRRHAGRDDQRPLFAQPAARRRLSAAPGRRPGRLFRHGDERLFAQGTTTIGSSAISTAGTCRRPIRRPSNRRPRSRSCFWIEKTVPFKYRKPIREGILEWNKAFEKAGFLNAIEVRQQPDNADWDAEDINYNTFRWITSSAGFAMGPSRANPITGQILNASIIFDADFLQSWKTTYEVFTPQGIAALTGGPLTLKAYQQQQERSAAVCTCRSTVAS